MIPIGGRRVAVPPVGASDVGSSGLQRGSRDRPELAGKPLRDEGEVVSIGSNLLVQAA
jgi:hypothetical protein